MGFCFSAPVAFRSSSSATASVPVVWQEEGLDQIREMLSAVVHSGLKMQLQEEDDNLKGACDHFHKIALLFSKQVEVSVSTCKAVLLIKCRENMAFYHDFFYVHLFLGGKEVS